MSEFTKNLKNTRKSLAFAASFSICLGLIKFIGFAYTGSLIVLASFFDSVADAASSIINNMIYKKSLESADKEHPFGHGGFEVIGALIQGLIITFFSLSLLVESIRTIFTGNFNDFDSSSLPLAIGVLLFSAFGGFFIHLFLNFHLKRLKEKNERSLVILADQAHYSGDVLANLASAGGLALVYYLDMNILDPIMGCVAALFLGSVAIPILKKAFKDIAHNEAPEELQQKIVDVILDVDERIKGIHHLRSREFGPYLFVDFHMKLPDPLTLIEAHSIGDRVETEIKKLIPNADVLIHLDPESEPDQKYWDPAYKIPEDKNNV